MRFPHFLPFCLIDTSAMDAAAREALKAGALELLRSGTVSLPARHDARPAEWVDGLLSTEPGLFLELFGRRLAPAQIESFRPLARSDYAVGHFLGVLSPPTNPLRIRNRRLQAARRLIRANDAHFSMDAIAERDWEMFSGVMGRHAKELGQRASEPLEEAGPSQAEPPRALSSMLLSAADGRVRRTADELRSDFEPRAEMAWSEPAPGLLLDDDGDDDALSRARVRVSAGSAAGELAEAGRNRSPEEEEEEGDGRGDDDGEEEGGGGDWASCRERLVHAAVRRFISGADSASFDYTAIDGDAGYDVSDEAARDAEDYWFGDGAEAVTADDRMH